jgi:hypothetical protein
MIVDWDFYIRRKRINIKAWLERKNVKDYNGLIEVTKKLGIETPSKEKVSKYFKKPEIKKNDKKIKKSDHKLDIISTEVHEKIESNSVSRVSNKITEKTQARQEEKPKQTRKRKPRKKRQPVKKED